MLADTCNLCYDNLTVESGRVLTQCNHLYCVVCFSEQVRISSLCAMCRTNMTPDNRTYEEILINDEEEIETDVESLQSEIDVLISDFTDNVIDSAVTKLQSWFDKNWQ